MTFEASEPPARNLIRWLPHVQAPRAGGEAQGSSDDIDPATILLTCANCGAPMDERKCKLICTCGYFLSCSDYY